MINGTQKCTRRYKDSFGVSYRCMEIATEIVNGKHLCNHHAKNSKRRARRKAAGKRN